MIILTVIMVVVIMAKYIWGSEYLTDEHRSVLKVENEETLQKYSCFHNY